jgi:predicted acyl esterase
MASDPIQRMKEYLQTTGASEQGLELMREKLAAFEAASKNIVVEKNLMVPMRDGVQLSADVYRPTKGGPFPVLLARTPYDKAELIMMLGTTDI